MSRPADAEIVIVGGGAVARFPADGVDWERTRRAAERVDADYYAVSPR